MSPARPPEPTGVRFHEAFDLSDDGENATVTQTVTWAAPTGPGLRIRVFGVTRCIEEPANAAPGSTGPCVVDTSRLRTALLRPLATAPASAGRTSWSWPAQGCNTGLESDPDGPTYYAIVVATYAGKVRSTFVVAEPGSWYVYRPGEIPC